MRPIRIAQVAPPIESVPPRLYGGTERVIHWLTEELVRRGHDVTLFASADSVTAARLVPVCRQALRLAPDLVDPYVYLLRALGLVFERAADFDLIHCHVDYFHLPFTRLVPTPVVGTLHGRLDIPDLAAIFGQYPDAPLISISTSQRRPLPWANWIATVYHGLPVEQFAPGPGDGGYLAFLGRISPEKGIDDAIAVARAVGLPLRIAAKIDRADRDYFESEIEPLLRGSGVEFIGEVHEAEKKEFLSRAKALLFPIRWPEPFGIVMIEALASGTPVLAFDHGSVSEVLVDGETGFICRSREDMVAAVRRLDEIDRTACRRYVERQFSVEAMADRYEAAYEHLLCADHLARRFRPLPAFPPVEGGVHRRLAVDDRSRQPFGVEDSPTDTLGEIVPG